MSTPPPGRSDPPRRSGLPVGDLPEPPGEVSVDLDRPAVALAVGAHPDDVEFGAGATLARWAAGGTRVHHVVLTDGSKGTWDPDADPAHLREARRAESVAAAEVIDRGAGERGRSASPPHAERVVFLERIDGELGNGPAERRELVSVIRRLRPDVVLAHDPWRRYRLHPDHRTAGFLTLDALVAARDPHFFPEVGPAPHRPSALLLWEADEANHVEGADERSISTKVAALLRHASQYRSTMGLDPGTDRRGRGADDFDERVRRQLASHGALAGLAAGEAFRLMTGL